jgi:hypothetical protein
MLAEVLGAQVVGSDGPRTVLEWRNVRYHLGPPRPGREAGQPLGLSHGEVQAVCDDIVAQTTERVLAGKGCWEVYRITLLGLETEERMVLIGDGHDDDWPVFATLAQAMESLQAEAEGQQARRIERLLAQLRGRRDDAQRYVDQQSRKLQEAVERAARARRMASSAAAAETARHQHVRSQQELERHRHQGETAMRERVRELDAEETRIRQQRYVQASASWLFSIRDGGPSTGENEGRAPLEVDS